MPFQNESAAAEDMGGGDWPPRGPLADWPGVFPMTANIDWCEANYVWTYYVAEFMNAVSSLAITWMGMVGLYHVVRQAGAMRFRVQFFALAFVGLGSALFHGTLLREGQVLDELPMLYGVLAGVYALLESQRGPPRRPLLVPALALGAVGITAVYFLFPDNALPQHAAFIVSVVYLTVASRRELSRMTRGRTVVGNMLLAGLSCYVVAAGCWLVDKLLCAVWPVQVLYLHAFWHVLAGYGSHLFIVFTDYHRATLHERHPTLRWTLGVPWVQYSKGV